MAISSVYDGTWGGSVPQEIIDFEIMREMHWSWESYERTPYYVRRFTWDCIQARREAEAEANGGSAENSGQGRTYRVKR